MLSRVIEQVEYRAKNWWPEQTVADKPVDNLFELKKHLTLRVEVLELAVAEEPDDKLFAPAFPVGTVIFDHQDKKIYEAGESGAIRPYRPTPAGFRGAVFACHILWISDAVTCLFRRRNFPAHYAMGRI